MMQVRKILVLDDDPDIGELIEATASGLGIGCIVTQAVSDFLMELGPEIDLILLDLMMPRIDGIEVLRRLGERNCQADVILMSGIDKRVIESAERTARSLGLRVKGHMQKPFRVAELETALVAERKIGESHSAKSARIEPLTEQELSRALAQGEFSLYYQPQVTMADSGVVGFEGLARWINPVRGIVTPDRFIPELERLNLIEQFTMQSIDQGFRDAAAIRGQLGDWLSLSINLSVQCLYDLNLPDRVVSCAKEHGFPPERLILEITESGLIHELPRTLDVLTRLRMKGIELSIDDFGTGYSMMQQLQLVPATELKIDRLFVQDMQRNESHRIVAQKTVELGHELGLRVVAEGVEAGEQKELLALWGCDVAQGYLYSRPIPLDDLVNWLETARST